MNDYTIGSDRGSITGVASIPVFFQRLATSTPFLESSSISARASSESRSCSIRPPPSLSWTLKESRILPRLRHSANATFEKLMIIPLGRLIRFSFIHRFCRLGIYSATAIFSKEAMPKEESTSTMQEDSDSIKPEKMIRCFELNQKSPDGTGSVFNTRVVWRRNLEWQKVR